MELCSIRDNISSSALAAGICAYAGMVPLYTNDAGILLSDRGEDHFVIAAATHVFVFWQPLGRRLHDRASVGSVVSLEGDYQFNE